MKEYFSTMHALAERLTRLLAVSVGIDPKFFEGCFSESMCFLRLNRYTPEVTVPPWHEVTSLIAATRSRW